MPLIDTALALHQLGANVTAVEARSKGPAHTWDQWQTERQRIADVQSLPWSGYTCRKETKRHKPGDRVTIGAIGIINGVGGWHTFDIDAPKDKQTRLPLHIVSDATVDQLLAALGLPATYAWVWRSGSGAGWEVAIRCDEPMPVGVLTEDKREKGVFTGWPADSGAEWHHIELRWETCQTVVVCTDDRGYAWRYDAPTAPPLLVPVRRVIAAFFALAPPEPWNLGTVDRAVVDQIKARFDLIAYAQTELGGETEREGREIRITGHQGLLIDPEKGIWYIHGEGIGGDALDLVAYCTYRTTARNLNGKSAEILERAARYAGVSIPDRKPAPTQTLVAAADAPPAQPAAPARGQLNPLPANDLMAMDIPAPRQFVEGLIREGLSFFIGQPGVGKTPALVQLVIALATGGLWLGVFRLPKIRVAYIGPEYDCGDIRNIIMESTGGQTALDNLILFTIENFQGPQTEEEALAMIDELVDRHRVEAIVVDLFPGFLPPEKFKQNAYRGDYREFLAYHRAALAHHIMLTGAWHGTKRDTNPASMYNGGQGFWGAAGGGRLVMYQDEEDQVKLWAQLRGNKPIAYTVSESFIAGCRLWAILEGSIPEPTFGSDIHRAIYRTIREHAPATGLTPKVIASLVRPDLTTSVNDAYIRKCIGVLHKRGLLHAIGDSYVTASLKSAGSQGSEGSHSQKGSQGSEGSEAWYDPESDPSDPSPIPSPIPGDSALDSGESTSDPSDPQLLAIPDFSEGSEKGSDVKRNGVTVNAEHKKAEYPELDPIPRDKHSTMFMMLTSSVARNQKLARERCEEYGIDYDVLRAWALEKARKEREKAKQP